MVSTDTKKAVAEQIEANKKTIQSIKDEIDKLDVQLNTLNTRKSQLQTAIKDLRDSNDRMRVDIGVAG